MNGPRIQGSIRRRLVILLLAGAAGLAVMLFVLVQTIARQTAQQSQDNILSASVSAILDSARFVDGEIDIDLPYSAFSMLGNVADERAFYAIYLDEQLLSGYAELTPLGRSQQSEASFYFAKVRDVEVRVARATRTLVTTEGPQSLEVSVAQTLNGQQQVINQINRLSILAGAGFFVLTALMAVGIANRAVQPLAQLAESVARRGPRDLRPVISPVPSEMAPLVASLNTFITRLKASLSRSEDFIAEAAHRVRTPLAIVRTQAEITLHRVNKEENRQALREIIRAIDESSRVSGQLLDHAMVAIRTDQLAHESVDFDDLVRGTIDRIAPISELREVTLVLTRADHVVLSGDPILLQNAISNVLDNAIKYSPSGGSVHIGLVHDDEVATLTISDEGAGFPLGELDGLMERFVRGSNAEDMVGSGLGLTIVDEVVRAHGGGVRISNTEDGGGACVELFFPLS